MNPTSLPPRRPPVLPPSQTVRNVVTFEKVLDSHYGHRAVLYGPGGIGKSTLACQAPGPVAFVDADESLEKLKPGLVKAGIPVPVKIPVRDWDSMRKALQSSGYDKIKSIVLDTWSPIEQWCVANMLTHTKNDADRFVKTIEEFGYGKGFRFAYDNFLPLLGDLDAHVRAGRNVIIVCHDDTAKIPNPAGQDFIRWEPKVQHTDKASMRSRIKEWADHVLYLAYDINVERQAGDKKGTKAGRATGVGSRTLHTAELPYFMAKSRTTAEDFDVGLGNFNWDSIIK